MPVTFVRAVDLEKLEKEADKVVDEVEKEGYAVVALSLAQVDGGFALALAYDPVLDDDEEDPEDDDEDRPRRRGGRNGSR